MKILFVDFDTNGHHGRYLRTLLGLASADSVLVLPNKTEEFSSKQYCIENLGRNMSFSQYRKVLREIKRIADIEKPDIIHILSGDFLYRFFGIGLSTLPKPVLVTFHHVIFSRIRCISYRQIFRRIETGIVHTEYIGEQLKQIGVKNIKKIEYPCFERVLDKYSLTLKDKYNIPRDRKVLLAFGGTRYDKGLDLLLDALKGVEARFHLVIAGKAEDFNKEFVEEHIKDYRQNVSCYLEFIEENMMEELFALCDIVVLPYRFKFAGASGPLTTGVANGKMIIGPDNNSVGDIICENHLGQLFRTEDVYALSKAIEKALGTSFNYDATALKYRDSLTKERFIQEYMKLYKSVIN